MAGERELHRFPKGETCSECPARRWYSENGFRYCQNGHRVEGFVEYDIDQEDNFGKTGHTARRQKEARQKQNKHLFGNAARELYLECLQLILRKQIAWIVGEKELPPELETVVRDLWDLRVRNLGGLVPAFRGSRKKRGTSTGSSSATQSASEGELVLFSSQGESEPGSDTTSTTTTSRWSRIQSWTSEEGDRWPLPTLLDTLALIYLGCLTIRQPIRIGDLCHWTETNKLVFRRAISELPEDMRGRLPAAYHGALRSRAAGVRPGELHEAVMNLTYSYGKNYDITFPPLNVPVIVLQYLKEMGLPVNLYPYIKECVSLLQLSYAIPTGGQKPLDNPDTLLIATVVVVTKLFHPLDGPENEPATESSPSGLKIDWQQWQRIFADTERLNTSRRDFDSVTPKEVGTMTGEEMDAYLEWFQQTRIMPQEDTRTIERLFPLGVSASPVEVDDTEEDNRRLEQRLLELQQHISWVNPELPIGQVPDSRSSSGGGRSYRRYENVDSLSGPAELFHQRAAMLSGLSIEGLLKAVFKLEQLLLYWTKYAQTESENDLKAEIEGSSNRSLARLLARKQIY